MPADEEMRSLTVESDAKRRVELPWHDAMKARGYAEAFRILDEIVHQLSGGKVALIRPTGSVHVVNPHSIE